MVQVRPPQQGRPLPRLLRVERDQAEVEPSKKDVVFPDQENSLWQRDPKTNECYLHHFYKHQPDLNVANPKVQEEISRTLGFWLELGVSGFRVVAVPFLFAKDVRRRLPSMLGSDQRRMRMAQSLAFSLPGTPVLFTARRSGWPKTSAFQNDSPYARPCSGPRPTTAAFPRPKSGG